jgi:hypothetical protein
LKKEISIKPMPTPQWLKNNPKISAHIPQPLYEKLEAFMRDRGLQKTAQAVTLVLTEYLSSPQLSTRSSPQLSTVNHSNPLEVVHSNPLEVVHSCPQLTTDKSLEELVKQQVERALQSREVVLACLPEESSPNNTANSSPHQDQKVVYSSEVKSSEVDHSCPQLTTDKQQWLTTGEAHSVAVSLGYRKSKTTLRRAIAQGTIPAELVQLGLQANWDFRKASHPKDNSVKWLRFVS